MDQSRGQKRPTVCQYLVSISEYYQCANTRSPYQKYYQVLCSISEYYQVLGQIRIRIRLLSGTLFSSSITIALAITEEKVGQVRGSWLQFLQNAKLSFDAIKKLHAWKYLHENSKCNATLVNEDDSFLMKNQTNSS